MRWTSYKSDKRAWRRNFALFPVVVAEEGNLRTWAWLEWYEYRTYCEGSCTWLERHSPGGASIYKIPASDAGIRYIAS